MANEVLNWPTTELATAEAINRVPRAIVSQSGLNPDEGFPGFVSYPVLETETDVVDPTYPYDDVRRFGAIGNGETDNTTYIQNAIGNQSVRVPAGSYVVDGTLEIGTDQELRLEAGAILVRVANVTTPIVQLLGNNARLTGAGEVSTSRASPDGVVLVGPLVNTTVISANFCRVTGIRISGIQADGNVGLQIRSNEGHGAGATYQGSFADLFIYSVGTGVKLEDYCNGHTFTGVLFYAVNQYAYHLVGTTNQVSENTVIGGFVHASGSMDTMIKVARGFHNLFYGLQGEPGGGNYFNLDANSLKNQILGYGDCPTTSVDSGTQNTILNIGTADLPTFKVPGLNVTGTADFGTSVPITRGFNDVQSDGGTHGLDNQAITRKYCTPGFMQANGALTKIKVLGLSRNTTAAYRSGAWYEVTVAGAAQQSVDKRYGCKLLLVTYNFGTNDTRLVAFEILPPNADVTYALSNVDDSVEFTFAGFGGASVTGEITVIVEKFGLGLADPTYSYS